MLLDPAVALQLSTEVLGYLTAVILGKALLVALVVGFLLRRSLRTSILVGLALAQTGEFSFVLATEANKAGLLGYGFQQVFVAGSVATLIATPFLVRGGPSLAGWASRRFGDSAKPAKDRREADTLRDHGVLIGFGVAGQNVARVLRSIDVPYVIVETNPASVEAATKTGENALYGDATRRPILERVGIERARFISVAISDPVATREVVSLARTIAPKTPLLVKTRYKAELDPLSSSGASVVVSEELEGTVDLLAHVLRQCDIAEGSITRFTGELREEGYQALRAPAALGIDPWLAEILQQVPTEWVEVPDGFAPGQTLGSLGIRARSGASVLVVERGEQSFPGPPPDFELQGNDRLLIFGSVDAAGRLSELLRESVVT